MVMGLRGDYGDSWDGNGEDKASCGRNKDEDGDERTI